MVPKFGFFFIGKQCETPLDPQNGMVHVHTGVQFGSSINYTCNNGWVGKISSLKSSGIAVLLSSQISGKISNLLLPYSVFVVFVLQVELKALNMLDKCSTTKQYHYNVT